MSRGKYADLIAAARRALEFAYAHYSGFRVGAAVLTEGGDVVPGCNIENAAYSPTLCAERGAIAGARARGLPRITAIAIVNERGTPCPPCGTCRQVLFELAPEAIVVLEDGIGGTTLSKARDLLPMAFGPDNIAKVPPNARA